MDNTSAFIVFKDLSFTYPQGENPVFDHFSAELPGGFVSLVGPNGSGKSTLLLLAAGRLLPQNGSAHLLGKNTKSFTDENSKNAYASFIYQNMEFETEDPLGSLLEQVYAGGNHTAKNSDFYNEVIDVFELQELSSRPLSKLSKGEMQRSLLAFSLLYGSRSIFMDEPVFALEERQKEKVLGYLRDYQKQSGITVYVSLHELELTRKFAETVLLFKPDRSIDMGTPEEVLTTDALEAAYGVPAVLLKQKEQLDRQKLEEEAELLKRS